MALRARSFTTVNDLRDFMRDEGIGRDEVYFFGINLSGQHEIIYNDAPGSVIEGSTAAERAVFDEVDYSVALDATQITASGGRTFTFDEGTATLTLSSGTLITTEEFAAGMDLIIAGTADNDGTFLIDSLTETTITIDTSADTDTYSVAFVDEGPLSATATIDGTQSGYSTNGASNLHVVFNLPDPTTSLEWQLYTYDSASELWALDTRPGSSGTVSVDDTLSPQRTILELGGIERVALVTQTLSGTFTTGYSAWMVATN